MIIDGEDTELQLLLGALGGFCTNAIPRVMMNEVSYNMYLYTIIEDGPRSRSLMRMYSSS